MKLKINNFSLNEMTKRSDRLTRKGISNNPSEDHMNNLKELCINIYKELEIILVELYRYLVDIEVQNFVSNRVI